MTSKLITALPDELKKQAASAARARAGRWAALTGAPPPSAAGGAAADGAGDGDGGGSDMFGLGGGLGDGTDGGNDNNDDLFGLGFDDGDDNAGASAAAAAAAAGASAGTSAIESSGKRALNRARARLTNTLAHLPVSLTGSQSLTPHPAAAAAEKQWAAAADAAEPDQLWARDNLAQAILCGLTSYVQHNNTHYTTYLCLARARVWQ